MIENSIFKSIGLLLSIAVGFFIGTYGITLFLLRDKELRKFWLKIWLAFSVNIIVLVWLILIFGENEHFK